MKRWRIRRRPRTVMTDKARWRLPHVCETLIAAWPARGEGIRNPPSPRLRPAPGNPLPPHLSEDMTTRPPHAGYCECGRSNMISVLSDGYLCERHPIESGTRPRTHGSWRVGPTPLWPTHRVGKSPPATSSCSAQGSHIGFASSFACERQSVRGCFRSTFDCPSA